MMKTMRESRASRLSDQLNALALIEGLKVSHVQSEE